MDKPSMATRVAYGIMGVFVALAGFGGFMLFGAGMAIPCIIVMLAGINVIRICIFVPEELRLK